MMLMDAPGRTKQKFAIWQWVIHRERERGLCHLQFWWCAHTLSLAICTDAAAQSVFINSRHIIKTVPARFHLQLAENIFNLAAIVCKIPFNSQAVEMNAGAPATAKLRCPKNHKPALPLCWFWSFEQWEGERWIARESVCVWIINLTASLSSELNWQWVRTQPLSLIQLRFYFSAANPKWQNKNLRWASL